MATEIRQFIMELQVEARKLYEKIQDDTEMKNLEEIAKIYDGKDKLIPFSQIAETLKTRKEVPHYKTGFNSLDAILKGVYPQQLVVIAAATKSGKTSFCVDLTSRFKEHNPIWLPFEEGAEELVQKFLDRGEEPPHAYTPEQMTGNTLLWVEKKIIEGKAKFNSKMIFIDHLHFIVPFSSERQDLAIGQAMRELKRMAKKWEVVVFLIAHLKKTHVETQPNLEDLRDSSFVAQEADTVLMLWRETKRQNGQVVITDNVNISVQANRRHGKTGNVQMIYLNGHFLEKEWTQNDTQQSEESW